MNNLFEFENDNMSNMIPPMLSSSPPPVDLQDDDDEEEEDFCNFGVSELDLNSSGENIGNDSPAKWKLPASGEPSIPIPQSPTLSKYSTSNDALSESVNSVLDFEDSCDTNKSLCNGGNEVGSRDEEKEDVEKDVNIPLEEPEPPDVFPKASEKEIEEEINSIPFPQVFSPCVSPPENELRTSPEGADSESVCADESFSWRKVSVPDGCELSSTVIDKAECTFTEIENTVCELAESKESGSVDDFGDFGDFADFSSQPFSTSNGIEKNEAITVIEPSLTSETFLPSNDGEDEFNTFESATVFEAAESSDEFDNFGSATLPPATMQNDDVDDEFDEFESASPVVTSPDVQENSFSESVSAFFPSSQVEPEQDPELTYCLNSCLDDSSSVWGHLKDLDASQALKLQWSNSTASKKLLSSLNIDSRNILIGARWNGNVPRFAANLSCAPLKPVKAENATPAPSVLRVPSSTLEDVVPAAQFDWNSSGLTNPLDCTEKNENVKGSPSELIMDVNPSQLPVEDVWSNSGVPSTDVLLPAPVEPHPINLDDMILKKLGNDLEKTNIDIDSETPFDSSWNNDNASTEQAKGDPDSWSLGGTTSSWNISSQLEERATELTCKNELSAEACRVVETLPDLSFLSARKLLYAANENMNRFHLKQQL